MALGLAPATAKRGLWPPAAVAMEGPVGEDKSRQCVTAKNGGQLKVEDQGNKVISPTLSHCNLRNK